MVTDARIFLSSSTSAMLAMIPAPISTEQYRAATGKAKPSCRKRRAARDSRGQNPCPDCQMNSTLRISYERAPPGVVTSTVSPLPLPIRARAIGDDSEILPCLASLSTSPTIWYLRFSSVSSSTNVTVAPNLTVLPESFGTSDLVFKLENAALDEALALLCGMVFGVLGKVAVRARVGDRLDDLVAFD